MDEISYSNHLVLGIECALCVRISRISVFNNVPFIKKCDACGVVFPDAELLREQWQAMQAQVAAQAIPPPSVLPDIPVHHVATWTTAVQRCQDLLRAYTVTPGMDMAWLGQAEATFEKCQSLGNMWSLARQIEDRIAYHVAHPPDVPESSEPLPL